MNDKHINRAFEQMSPTKEQREKMFDRIKNEVSDEKRTKKNPFGSPTPDVRGERNGYSD